MGDVKTLNATPIEHFVTQPVHTEADGELKVMLAVNGHTEHYVMSKVVARELVVGLEKALEKAEEEAWVT